MSDEGDYMSDQFIATVKDICPSLIQDRRKRRLVDVEQKTKESKKRQQEECGPFVNRLQASLKKTIGDDNKGFQLLTKMGYKPGQALGKQRTLAEDKVKSTIEPISIIIKADRSGLGRDAALRELNEKRQQIRQKRLLEKLGASETLNPAEFRKRSIARADERFVASAFKKCQITCQNLDTAANVSQPAMVWFWPEPLPQSKTDESESPEIEAETETETETEYPAVDKLEMLTNYLRTAYLFCFWCGVKYESLNDINVNCPGLTRNDH